LRSPMDERYDPQTVGEDYQRIYRELRKFLNVTARAEPTAAGLWEQVDDNSGKPESWFKITERNGVYVGNLVKIFFKPGEDENWVCDRCEGAEKGAPVSYRALKERLEG